MLPQLSIIIPTYNRKELLIKLLNKINLLQAPKGEIEVIVVDDGSTDDTQVALKKIKLAASLKVISHNTSRGPAAARNHGASVAQGEILGFLDSDVLVSPKWWQAAKPHFEDPQVVGVEGKTMPPAGGELPDIFTHSIMNKSGGSFLTCNIFYRKNIFEKLGGFDKRFDSRKPDGTILHIREDTDFAFRVLQHGWQIIFEPACEVEHPVFSASKIIYIKETRYALLEPLLRRKHPELYKQYLSWITGRAFPVFYWGIFLSLPLCIIGWLLAQKLIMGLGLLGFVFSWGLSGYAFSRKRRSNFLDWLILYPQFLIIPWLRLYWLLKGEWKWRRIKAYET